MSSALCSVARFTFVPARTTGSTSATGVSAPLLPTCIVMSRTRVSARFFFFIDAPTTEIYTLSLHDALPISISRFRACWATHFPAGCDVTPSTWTRRVATSITNSTYSRLSNTVPTVKKSIASTSWRNTSSSASLAAELLASSASHRTTGRTTDRAVAEPCTDHGDQVTTLTNSQLSTHNRFPTPTGCAIG